MPDAEGHPAVEEIEIGALFAALADPHRRRVVEDLLDEEDGGERTCSSFNLPVTKSTLTHHFRVLRESGLVRQVDRRNSRKVTLRRAELQEKFPGLLDVIRVNAAANRSSSMGEVPAPSGTATRVEGFTMADKQILQPGPDHPITVGHNRARVVVSLAGTKIADTQDALTLRESTYPAVQYIPRKDVDMSLLERTDHETYCPYKGDAAYYTINAGGHALPNAVWTYEQPYESVADIKDHLAFYTDQVELVEQP